MNPLERPQRKKSENQQKTTKSPGSGRGRRAGSRDGPPGGPAQQEIPRRAQGPAQDELAKSPGPKDELTERADKFLGP